MADSTNDLELALKKRARRRLVGAIALVLLMVIVLPMVLQDRSALAPQEAIKITMPEEGAKPQTDVITTENVTPEPPVDMAANETLTTTEPPSETTKETTPAKEVTAESETKNKPQTDKAEVKQAESKAKEDKPVATKLVESKPAEAKPTEEKQKTTSSGSFAIQVGVFSDMENVKQLQARLKQAGLASHTEKITTPKGEKIRLRAGSFSSRQEAAYALTKLQEADLTGMVISNN
jgi:DedD protein